MNFFKQFFTLEEAKSIFQTWVAGLPFDVLLAAQFTNITNGDWNTGAFYALGSALFRSILKAVWEVVSKQLKTNSDVQTNIKAKTVQAAVDAQSVQVNQVAEDKKIAVDSAATQAETVLKDSL